jgi:hypothetical protein
MKWGRCDDGGVAESFSDSVGRLLAGPSDDLEALARLCVRDDTFCRFAMRHIDETIPLDVTPAILHNVRARCPLAAEKVCGEVDARMRQLGALRGE